jgi:exonuclease V gamma subunit
MNESRLRIFASNRLETLLDALSSDMRADPLGPLEREVIVVQSRGMYRWVTLGLARSLGIAATIATPFPGTFCQALAERVDGSRAAAPSERYEPAPGSPYERDALTWLIFALLGTHDRAVSGPAAAYLADDRDQRKRHQLASRLAERFDEYLLYRPDVLLAWESGKQPIAGFHVDAARWQAALWRAIVARAGKAHPARRLTDLVERLRRGKSPVGLPPRVNVFGASSLPPVFLDVLGALALHAPVSIYTVSPTDRYWADIRPERTVAAQLELFRERGLAGRYAHAETGNRLLASLGRQGRELHQLLLDRDPDGSAWRELPYTVPARNTLLGTSAGRRGRARRARAEPRALGHDRSARAAARRPFAPGARLPFAHARDGSVARPPARRVRSPTPSCARTTSSCSRPIFPTTLPTSRRSSEWSTKASRRFRSRSRIARRATSSRSSMRRCAFST